MNIKLHLSQKFSFILLLMITHVFYAQCPSLINNQQIFCNTEAPTISNLQAIDNGSGIAWFNSPTATTPLNSFDVIFNGTTYFLDNANGDCGNRQAVTVSILSAPIGPNFQGFCEQNGVPVTVADLAAIGIDVQWFTSPEGGTPILPTTQLVANTIYFGSQTNPQNGCFSSRLSVFVTIGSVDNPVGETTQTFCVTDPNNPPTVSDLVVSGNNNWYLSNTSVVPLNPNTILVNNQTYYVTTVAPPCESSFRLPVTVVLLDLNNAGENTTVDLCEINLQPNSTLDLVNLLNGNPSQSGVWTGPVPISNGGIGTVSTNDLTVENSPYIFNYEVTTNTLCPPSASQLIINVFLSPDAGIGNNIVVCSNDASFDLFDLLGGTPDANGFWTPSLNSETSIFNPAVDSSGSYTYTVNSNNICPDVSSVVEVTVNINPNTGTDSEITICENESAFDLFNLLGPEAQVGGFWLPALASGTNIFNPDFDQQGTYVYTILGQFPCEDSQSSVLVLFDTPPNAGDDAIVNICSNDSIINLLSILGPNAQEGGIWTPSLVSGNNFFNPLLDTGGIYTYTVTSNNICNEDSAVVEVILEQAADAGQSNAIVICQDAQSFDLFDYLLGTPQINGTWSPPLQSGTGLFDPSVDVAGIYTYTIIGNGACENDSATIEVSLQPNFVAGDDAQITFCSNDAPFDLFSLLGNNAQLGGVWSPALQSGTGVFNPEFDLAGNYTYTLIGNEFCEESSAVVSVSIEPAPFAGNSIEIFICENSDPINLLDLLDNADSNGTWNPPLTNNLFDPLTNSEGIYTYTVQGNLICPADSSTVTVNFEPFTDAGDDAEIIICSNSQTINLFDVLGGNPQIGGTWSPPLMSGSGIFNPAIDVAGVYTYTVFGNQNCGNDSANVNVQVQEAPNAGNSTDLFICNDEMPINLFSLLGLEAQPNGTWSPFLPNGVFDPSVNVTGVYSYTVAGTAPCFDAIAEVNIVVGLAANAGTSANISICQNASPIDLFDFLGGNPDVGGTWSPTLFSNSSIFDPSIDAPGSYTYTVVGQNGCSNDTSTITVTTTLVSDAGQNGTLSLCSNDAIIDLFDSLNGSPQVGGTWTPSLASGTGLFDPSVDLGGVYTYAIIGQEPCGNAFASVTVIVNEAPNAGISSNITICNDAVPFDLSQFLGNDVTPGGIWSPLLNSGQSIFNPALDAPGIYTYTVQNNLCTDFATVSIAFEIPANAGTDTTISYCQDFPNFDLFEALNGNPQIGGTWNPPLSSGNNIFNPQVDASGTYTYTVLGSANCSSDSATITLNLIPNPNAGDSNLVDLCNFEGLTDLFDFLGPEAMPGGVWEPSLSSGTGLFNPLVDQPGVYTYTLGSGMFCTTDSATITVVFNPNVNAGNDNSLTICQNSAPIDLFLLLGNNANLGGFWSPALNSGVGLFDPSFDNAGIYTYTVSNSCGSDSAVVTISFENNVSAGTNGTVEVCSNSGMFNLFDFLGGSPTSGGTWSPTLPTTNGTFDPSINPAGVYTYSITDDGNCGTLTATVTVSIQQPINAGNSSSLTICQNTPSLNLFFFLGNSATPGGTWNPPLASGTNTYVPNSDGQGVFTYTVGGNDVCEPSQSTVTVNFILTPISGDFVGLQNVCETETSFDLFDLLDGTQDTFGVWLNAQGQIISNIIDPSTMTIGVQSFVYLVSNSCQSSSTIVQLNVAPIPTLTQDDMEIETPICSGENATILISSLPDGNYTTFITATGNNNFEELSFEFAVTNGIANLQIPSNLIPNEGNTVFQFLSILNSDTNCGSNLDNVFISLDILLSPSLSADSITTTSPFCLGDEVILFIENALDLPDGLYSFQIEIPENENLIVEINDIEIIDGEGQINLPIDLFVNSGTYNLFIINILSQSTTCSTILNFTIPIVIDDVPNIEGLLVNFESDVICLNGTNSIVFSNGVNIMDGTYLIEFTLSGAVSFVDEVEVNFVNGSASINLDQVTFDTFGTVILTISSITNLSNVCGEAIISIENSFIIEEVQAPIVQDLQPFCLNGNATLNELSATLTFQGTVVWFDSIENGNELPLETVLENDITYFAQTISDNGCISNRTPVLVTLEDVQPPTIQNLQPFCIEENPTLNELNSMLSSQGTLVWFDAIENGNELPLNTVLVNESTYYAATILNNGCISTRIPVVVSVDECLDPQLLIPDGFSPNNDGVNDTFEILNLRDLFPNFDLEIYNRFGVLVYKGNSNTLDWDGKTNQKGIKLDKGYLSNGVYFYILYFNNGILKPKQGRVYLNR